mgnify:CR=1 FL=1
MNIDAIQKDGFSINEARSKIQNIAFISLRIALRSYFRTYQSLGYNIRFLDNESFDVDVKNAKYNMKYIEDFCIAITNFQLFVELVIKDILSKVHPLLAIDAAKKHDLLFDLLRGSKPSEEELQQIKQLEFSEVFNR